MKIYVLLLLLVSCASAILEKECLQRVENAKTIGTKCSDQLKVLCQRHDILFTFWDASSRFLRTGLTYRSPQDMGNYDECMKVDEFIGQTNILGKFCLFQWSTQVPRKGLEELVAGMEIYPHLKEAEAFIEGKLEENITTADSENILLTGSVCISDGCSPEEFNEVFKTHLYPVIPLNKFDCVTKNSNRDLTTPELIGTICLAVVVLTMVSCTIIHVVYHYKNIGEVNDFVKGFSAFYNGTKLISISTDNVNQIRCMDGLRFISILWIIAGHGYVTYVEKPLYNNSVTEEWKSYLYSQYIQAAIFAVDTFFFLSGFLLTYGYLQKVKNKTVGQQITVIPLNILLRYLRLTPAVGAMFLLSVSSLKLLGDGPLWDMMMNMVQSNCNKYWWRFFLYFQNYYPDDLCYTQTWYLSADMQMFVFAPLVLIPTTILLKNKLPLVMTGLITLTVFFVGITIAIPYIFTDYSNEYNTHSRVSSYLVGMIGGVIFHRNRGKVIKINRIVNLILWVITFAVMMFLVLYHQEVTQYPTKLKTTLFGAIYEPIWCTCILWIVFSCYHGYGGIVNWFLSNGLCQIGARLSYCLYVLHTMVIIYSIATTRTLSYFSDYVMVNTVGGYVNTSILLSIFWTLTFEGPVIMFNKKLFQWIGSPKRKKENNKGVV